MNTAAQRRINQLFDQAEHNESCLVPSKPADTRWLQRASQRGEVVRPAVGIYVRADYWQNLDAAERMLHIMRALSRLHPDWVFAGYPAALAHGLDVGFNELAEVCLATGATAHTSTGGTGRRIIVSHDTPVVRQGVPVTSFPRTVGDCLRTLGFAAALAIADSALRLKNISADRLERNVCAVCSRHPGLQRVRDIIRLADGRAENGGESKTRAHMIRLGFAVPDQQRPIKDPLNAGSEYYVDFAWDLPDKTVVLGELDGKEKYLNPHMTKGKSPEEVLFDERRRESRITLGEQPVKILRFSFAEACDDTYFSRLLSSYGVPRATYVPPVALT